MQLLFESSSEFFFNKGLGIFKGAIKSIKNFIKDKNLQNTISREIKLPHMGWNYLSKYFGDPKYCKFKEFTSKSFYFVHSYGLIQ